MRHTSFKIIVHVMIGLWAMALSAEPSAAGASFTFVQLCDPQLGFGGYERDVESLRQAVRQINALKPDLVVVCGDLVNTPSDEAFADFKTITGGLEMPCFCAPGNHDVGNTPTAESLKRFRECIGEDFLSVDHHGYTFVVVNASLWKSPLEKETALQDAWFTDTLREARGKGFPVFVVSHYPLFESDPEEEESYYNLPRAKRKALLALCAEGGVVAILAGHTHKQIINDFEGIQLVNGETTCNNFDGRPLGFRLWTVRPGRAPSHRFVALERVDPEKAVPAQ